MFVICTDDIKWAQRNFQALLLNVSIPRGSCEPRVAFSVNHTTAEDMAILASCNHSVITQGAFGYWAAYLAGGETVRCKNYPLTTITKSKLMNIPEDIFPPSWIAL